jgi:UDP-2-acetamido-2,6-beta-L-arabino-hexul-4-ose reductase
VELVNKQIVKRFFDYRGFVFEPIEEKWIAQQKNVHVVVSRPGAVRGNHYHGKGTETLIVCGPALVRIRQGRQREEFSIPADNTFRMVIPPGISHAIQNTGTVDSLLVAFNTSVHDSENPDTVEDILIPAD